jgi:chemotaxis protein MotB
MAQNDQAPVIIKRKKVSGGDGHHGGAWKVAYADFVTAMMAFFLLMWLLNATTEKQRKGLADYFSPSVPINRVSGGGDGAFGGNSTFATEKLPQNGTGAEQQYRSDAQKAEGDTGVVTVENESNDEEEPLREIEEALKGVGGESLVTDEALKHIVTRVTDEGLVIELFARDGAPLFAPGTTEETTIFRDTVDMIARVVERVDNGIAISSHIQSQPVVLAENPVWEMSTARAVRTRELMQLSGTKANRFKRVTGHADRKLADDNPMSVRNNRIEIIVLRTPRKN